MMAIGSAPMEMWTRSKRTTASPTRSSRVTSAGLALKGRDEGTKALERASPTPSPTSTKT